MTSRSTMATSMVGDDRSARSRVIISEAEPGTMSTPTPVSRSNGCTTSRARQLLVDAAVEHDAQAAGRLIAGRASRRRGGNRRAASEKLPATDGCVLWMCVDHHRVNRSTLYQVGVSSGAPSRQWLSAAVWCC